MEKYIHYCWFGGNKMPKLARKCIKSWKKYLPDYKIIEWNEKNFDVNLTKFSKKAYKAKNWAFVSDVARVYALKEMGGIYLDTDMMITKKLDKEMLNSNFFVGWESDINIAVGVLGAAKGSKIIEKLYNIYETVEFDPNDLYRITIPRLLTDLLKSEYKLQDKYSENQVLEDNTHIYARDYFYPISSDKRLANLFTENTCMIHYYSGSWLPRDQQLQFKFEQMFGKKLGDAILKVLVTGKHALIKVKKIIKKICKVLFYPLVKLRRKRYQKYLINLKKERVDKATQNIKTNQIIFYNEDWLGVKTATQELFKEKAIGTTELAEDEVVEYFAKRIVEKNVNFVAFSGFAEGWEKLAKALKALNSNIKIKVIWHGSICMNLYDYDYLMFTKIFELLNSKVIDSIAFVKKSMYEFFKKKGYNAQFIANTVNLDKSKIKIDKAQNNGKNKIRIGIYASGDRWVKNFYNQIAAASLLDNCIVDCVPINYKAYELAKIFNLEIKGLSTTMSHEKLLKRMAQNNINLYVTFSECAPIIPLESLELGVPCIVANNNHYFEGTKLEEFLVVKEVDNVNVIYEGIKKCLDNKEVILEEYGKWKKDNDLEAEKTIKQFLEN